MTTEPIAATAAPSRARYVVLIGLCLAATIAYVQRNTLGVVEKEMRAELRLTTEQSALVMTTGFFMTYALFQVPGGWLGHVWGSRRALVLFAVVCTGLHGLCRVVTSLPIFVGVRGAMGASQAGLFPCTTGTIKSWFPSSQWGIANGMLTAFQQIGGAGGAIAVGYLAASLGWRSPFLIFALPGFLWAAWFWYWFRDRPQDHPDVNAVELSLIRGSAPGLNVQSSEEPDALVPWRALLLSRAMTWICIQQFFRGAGYIFYSSWFTTYLRESRGVDIKEAGWLTSLPLWANALGCLLGGGLSDWLLFRTGSRRISRQGLAVGSQLACAVFVMIAYPVHDATIAVLIISVGSFCAAAGGPIAYAISIDMGGNHVRPVFSLMNMWGNLGSLAFPMVIAWLVGKHPQPADWDPVLPVFAGIYVIAGLSWLGFNPDRPILAESRSGFPESTPNDKLSPPNSDLGSK